MRPIDCRALLKTNIQMLRMFSELFPNRLPGQLLSRNGVRDAVREKALPYPLLSHVLDFFLFCVESRRPNLNFLTVERIAYELVPFMDEGMVEPTLSPIPQASLIRWRKHLRGNERFGVYEEGVAKDCDKLGHWAFLGPIEGLPKGALFKSPSCTRSDLRLQSWNGRSDLLSAVCSRFRLEMIGSYEDERWRGRALNYLPQRIHFERRDTRVCVAIPDFYTHDMLRKNEEGDLSLLTEILNHGEKAPAGAAIDREELRELGVKLRHGLRQSRGLDYSRKVIRVIWAAMSYDPERVLGAGWKEKTTGELPSLSQAVEAVIEALDFIRLSRRHLRLWCDVLFTLTSLGSWEPAVTD